ncbi:MAG: ABC transporter permease [Anaerolineaceae bacterium]|nr:ABC transporter permease [Anaerolineaceae bacterium]
MGLYFRLAWRNIWRHRNRTLIIVLAIGLVMAFMMLFDGVMAGFENSIYTNAIRVMGGNIQVNAEGYHSGKDKTPLLPLENDTEVVEKAMQEQHVIMASRRIVTSGLITNAEGSYPVRIVGVEPERELEVSIVAQNSLLGRYLKTNDEDMIYIGQGLAESMGVKPGDRLTLVGRAEHEQMRTRTMTVADIYDVGMPQIEKGTVYISLAEAQELYGLRGSSTEVMIVLEQLGQEPGVIENLRVQLPGNDINSWEVTYPELQAAISSKSGVMDVVSIVILGIAGIGILNLLSMAVYERTREIGVMAAMGLKPRQISFLFMLEGTMIGLVGVIFGIGLGILTNAIFGQIGMDYSQFSDVTEYTALITDRIYPTLGLEKLLFRGTTALIISILAAFVPAREASQNEPASSLHYV